MSINREHMPQLNMPLCELKIKEVGKCMEVWDIIRKRYVALTPEEWVRQHVIHSLHEQMGYPLELMQVEGKIELNGLIKRCDLVVYNQEVKPCMIVECKKPEVALSQHVVDQICRYNVVLRVPYLYITNGLEHLVLRASEQGLRCRGMLPMWETLKNI